MRCAFFYRIPALGCWGENTSRIQKKNVKPHFIFAFQVITASVKYRRPFCQARCSRSCTCRTTASHPSPQPSTPLQSQGNMPHIPPRNHPHLYSPKVTCITHHTTTSLLFFQNGAKSGFKMCFAPSTVGAGGSQPNHASNPGSIIKTLNHILFMIFAGRKSSLRETPVWSCQRWSRAAMHTMPRQRSVS